MPTSLSIETFSHQVLRLAQLPAGLSPARLMDEGLDLLQTLVPFDAAWWGECSGGVDGRAPRNWLHGRRNLGAGMAVRRAVSSSFCLRARRNNVAATSSLGSAAAIGASNSSARAGFPSLSKVSASVIKRLRCLRLSLRLSSCI